MPKQLNVDLRLNMDSRDAKQKIADLQAQLTKLGTTPVSIQGFRGTKDEISKALGAATQLRIQLQEATSVKTGKLDLTKFYSEMKRSGTSLEYYKNQLSALGPEGKKAFVDMASAVAEGEMPLRRTNKLLLEMGTVLKNTIKWQISSSAIHAFMGSMQKAYTYAQELNKSLTDIRIVTSNSAEYMADFAARANKAAQALNTTTNAYAEAALIFFQQGLDDQAVEERTNTVIKMAQVTGDAMAEVSSYMTAVWNNFDDGSESLEHYADVITNLGAATAASSAEIAQGLEKFAAIAETVGLSYDYATTALATVVSQTRQSADVVGTAFKTIFARFQDLELGNTLDDGTTLGQYSQALQKVGVEIMDSNGQLRDMDDILDDMGKKWTEIGQAERVALAQNVAGQRQYAQLVALMDNWDTFQKNLATAEDSDGTLQEQADIYADSWEASTKRVEAAMEGLYQQLVDDDFFIGLNNALADSIGLVEKFIDSIGGVRGVVLGIGAIFSQVFREQIAEGMRGAAMTMKMLTPSGRNDVRNLKVEAINHQKELLMGSIDFSKTDIDFLSKFNKIYKEMIDKADTMTSYEEKAYQIQLDRLKAAYEYTVQLEKQAQKQEEMTREALEPIQDSGATGVYSYDIARREHEELRAKKGRVSSAAKESYVLQIQEMVRMGSKNGIFNEEDNAYLEGILNSMNPNKNKKDLMTSGEEILDFAFKRMPKIDVRAKELSKAATFESLTNKVFERSNLFKDESRKEKDIEIFREQIKLLQKALEELGIEGSKVDKVLEEALGADSADQAEKMVEEVQNAASQLRAENENLFDAGGRSVIASVPEGEEWVREQAEENVKVLKESALKERETKTDLIYSSLGFNEGKSPEKLEIDWADESTKLVNSITQLGFAFSNLGAIFEVVGDESIELKDKIGMVASSIGTAAPSLMYGLNSLSEFGKSLPVLQEKLPELRKYIGESGSSFGTLFTKLAPFMGKFLLLAAAVGALIYTFKKLQDVYNKDAINAERSAKAAENLANKAQEAKTAYEDLKTTISDYKSAKDALSELTKGTEEWRDALRETNEQAMELISAGNLNPSDYHWENGLLVIDEKSIQEARAELERQMITSEAASQMANAYATGANAASMATNIVREDDFSRYINNRFTSFGANALYVGDLINIQSIVSENIEPRNNLAQLAQDYINLGEAAFETENLIANGFENATDEMINSIRQYAQQVEEAENQTRLYSEQIAQSVLGENFSDEAVGYAAGAYSEEVDRLYEEVLAQTKDNINQLSGAGDSHARALWDRYQQATGITAELKDVTGDDDNRAFEYIDASGQLVTVTAEMVASTISSAEAMGSLTESAQTAARYLSQIAGSENADILGQAVSNIQGNSVDWRAFLSESATNAILSESGYANWEAVVNGEDYAQELAVDEAEAALAAMGISKAELIELAEELGLDSTEVIADFIDTIAELEQNLREFHETLDSEIREILENNNDVSIENQRRLNAFYEEATLRGGGDLALEILRGSTDLNALAEGISNTNWGMTYTEFSAALREAGVETENMADSIYELFNAMKTVTEETHRATAELYASYREIANGLTDVNDEISQEQYESLDENLQQFFARTIDGTYKLLSTAEEFQDTINEMHIADSVQEREALRSNYEELLNAPTDLTENSSGYTGATSEQVYNYGIVDSVTGEILSRHNTREEALEVFDNNYSGQEGVAIQENVREQTGHLEVDVDHFQQIYNILSKYDEQFENIGTDFENMTMEQLDGLNAAYEDFINNRLASASEELYGQIMEQDMAIALNFDDLGDLQSAYDNGEVMTNAAYTAAAIQIDQAQDTAMLDPEEWEEYSEYIQEAADSLEGYNDTMNEMEADIVSKSIMKMNLGLEALSENFEEWSDILANSTEASQEYADVMHETREALSNLLDVSLDYVSSDFVATHLEEIEAAAQGDEEAIEALRNVYSDYLAGDLAAELAANSELSTGEIRNQIQEIQDLASQFEGMDVGASVHLDGTDGFVQALNEMIANTGMTVDQVNALCDSMGFEANVATENIPTYSQIPRYRTFTRTTDLSGKNSGGWDSVTETRTEIIGYDKVEGSIPGFAMTTDGSSPVIESLTRKPTAGASNLSSSNRGGSGGGGGGGRSKKDKKDPIDEGERYHVINNQLEDNANLLEQVATAKDKAYGKNKLNLMRQEIDLQQRQLDLESQKLQEVEDYYEKDMALMKSYGALFDENGTITNYDALLQEQVNKFNAAVDAYNAGTADEAAMEVAEKEYEAFTEALKQYEDTQDLWFEQFQKTVNEKNKLLELKLKAVDYTVEFNITLDDESLDQLDFLIRNIKDDAYQAGEVIANLGEQAEIAYGKIDTYRQGFVDTLKAEGFENAEDILGQAEQGGNLLELLQGQSLSDEAISQLTNYIEKIREAITTTEDLIKAGFDAVKNVFTDSTERMDEFVNSIENAQDVSKAYMDIIDLVGRKPLGITTDLLADLNNEGVLQATNKVTATKANQDNLRAQLNAVKEIYAKATTDEERKYYQELIDDMEKELVDATKEFHSAWLDALEANLEAFKSNMELTIEAFEDAVGDLDGLKSLYELRQKIEEQYEPEYERWYQLSNLIKDIEKSTEDMDNNKTKKELLELEEEIIALQERGAELSEYDLNYLRLRYESKLAEAQLAEAQNAKSQVRMTRDSEGNYSYVYTADENKVAEAEDNYANKIYEMEKANQEYIENLQLQLMEVGEEMQTALTEAGELFGIGTAEYYARVEEIHKVYGENANFIRDQLANAFENNTRLREEDIVQYVEYTGDIAAQNVELTEDFGETYLGIETGAQNLDSYFNDIWLPSLESCFETLKTHTENYVTQEKAIFEEAKNPIETFSADAQKAISKVTEETKEVAEATKEYSENAPTYLKEILETWQTNNQPLIEEIANQEEAISNLADAWTTYKKEVEEAIKALETFNGKNVQGTGTPTFTGTGNGGSGGSGGGGFSGGGNYPDNSTNNASLEKKAFDSWLMDKYKDRMTASGSGIWGKIIGHLVTNYGIKRGATAEDILKNSKGLGNIKESLGKLFNIQFFDTGGYTGAWGSDGRWAVLHQKELVLNAKDTENFLSAIDIVRELAQAIDLNALAASGGLSSMYAPGISNGAQALEQEVHITANFPNATNRDEIMAAFDNVINLASQYANKK